VLHLEYEAYEEMAEPMLAALGDELTSATALRVAIHHRLGGVEIGEPSVVIAVSAPHRSAALDACREAIETLQDDDPALEERGLRRRRGMDRAEDREHPGRPGQSADRPPLARAAPRRAS
jgi:hypothetical protein